MIRINICKTHKHSYFPHHETNRIKINLQYTIYHQSTANSERVAMCSKPLVKLLMVIHFIRLTVCDIFSIKLYLFVYLFILRLCYHVQHLQPTCINLNCMWQYYTAGLPVQKKANLFLAKG